MTAKEIEAKKKAALEALPTKGKPESFFHHQGPNVPLTFEQIQFVWAHYPLQSDCPHTIFDWLIE
jgi:hypothetical protein